MHQLTSPRLGIPALNYPGNLSVLDCRSYYKLCIHSNALYQLNQGEKLQKSDKFGRWINEPKDIKLFLTLILNLLVQLCRLDECRKPLIRVRLECAQKSNLRRINEISYSDEKPWLCIDGADDDLVSTFAAMRTVLVVVVHTFTFFHFSSNPRISTTTTTATATTTATTTTKEEKNAI